MKLTGKHERAAHLVAADRLNDRQIAQAVGVSRSNLANWKKDPEFQAKVSSILAVCRKEFLRYEIAHGDQRMGTMNRRWKKLHSIIEARSKDPVMLMGAGGETGLLCVNKKSIGSGITAETFYEFKVDTGLLSELRSLEEAAAIETGQRSQKIEHAGEVLIRHYVGVDIDLV